MKINISLANILAKFKRGNTALFWVILIILIALEFMVLQRSAAIVVSLRNPPPAPLPNRSVRVNFSAYDEVMKRIGGAKQQNIPASPPLPAEPFGVTVEPSVPASPPAPATPTAPLTPTTPAQ